MLPVAPPSPNYVPSPEEPQTPPAPQDEDEHEPMFIQPHDPDFVPEPIYPEYIPLEDEHVLLAEEQPLPPVVSPNAESPEYVAESDPEEDQEEYKDDETEDGPIDYPMEGGDDDDVDSSGDDADETRRMMRQRMVWLTMPWTEEMMEMMMTEMMEMMITVIHLGMTLTMRMMLTEEDDEHLAPADSAVVIPTDELAAISFPPQAEVERLLAMPTPPPSSLASLSPPSAGEHLASEWPQLHVHHHHPHHHHYYHHLGVQPKFRHSDSQRVDLLIKDRITHQETIQIVEEEAYAAREAWAHLIGLSQVVYSELQTHQEQYASQAPSSTPLSITYPSHDFQFSVNHNVYNASSSIPQMEYAPAVHPQSEFSLPDTRLVVLVFHKGDDPIAINHMMSFLTTIVTSQYPATNNQLRTSSNPRQQATIN
nr:hypothetical protein [Tanacetum cinerariifolium]